MPQSHLSILKNDVAFERGDELNSGSNFEQSFISGEDRPLCFSDLPIYSSVLLLQGPVGPFFRKLADHLEGRGSTVYKVNFNPGDDYFYPPQNKRIIQFRHRLEFWPKFAHDLLIDKKIKAVFLFGDCRPIHQSLKILCQTYGIDLWVMEEGYYRPNLFTLEKGGVNYHSPMVAKPIESILQEQSGCNNQIPIEEKYQNGFWYMVRYAIAYWLANLLLKHNYLNYSHHRNLNIQRGYKWIKSFFCYWLYQITERDNKSKILAKSIFPTKMNSYFLLPLQVFDDSQLTVHSDFESVDDVLEVVLSSFAKHLSKNKVADVIIIKHHPMDRGLVNYQSTIERIGSLLNICQHIIYIHNIRLPDLFPLIDGCITVNSTIGLQALDYDVPTINLGRSFYDRRGLTSQNELDEFWNSRSPVDKMTIELFKSFVIRHSQVNGSLYSPNYTIK